MLPEFEIFGRTIGTYSLCSILGLIVCGLVATLLAKRFKYDYTDIILVMLSICAGLLIGSHILYAITRIDDLIVVISAIGKAPFDKLFSAFTECIGGMVFYGGFIGGALGIIVHTKYSKTLERKNILDIYAVSIPLFHTFGRIGCFLGGCCYGKEWSWGIIFPENKIIPELAGPIRFPVQLFEAGFNLLIFVFIMFLFIKRIYSGQLIYVYMLTYPVVRFVLEFFRGDEIRGAMFGLSTSQWVSIILFVFAIVHIFLLNKDKRKYKE